VICCPTPKQVFHLLPQPCLRPLCGVVRVPDLTQVRNGQLERGRVQRQTGTGGDLFGQPQRDDPQQICRCYRLPSPKLRASATAPPNGQLRQPDSPHAGPSRNSASSTFGRFKSKARKSMRRIFRPHMTHHPTHHRNGSTYCTLQAAADTNGSHAIVHGIAGPNT